VYIPGGYYNVFIIRITSFYVKGTKRLKF